MPYDRKPLPYVPMYFQTNYMPKRGTATASRQPDPDERCTYYQFINPFDLYEFLMKKYSYQRLANRHLQWLMKHSAVCTSLFRLLRCMPSYSEDCPVENWDSSFAYRHLKAAQKVCAGNGVAFRMIYVPYVTTAYKTAADYGNLPDRVFKDLKGITTFPLGLTEEDNISEQNAHFNDRGNRKFAEVCKKLIRNRPLEQYPVLK